MTTTSRIVRAASVVAMGVVTLALAACGTDAPEPAPTTTPATPTTQVAEPAVTADKTESLSEGDTITAKATGLNPKRGYYAAICATSGPAGAPPLCTGERADTAAQQWLTNKPGGTAPLHDDGSAEFTLKAVSTGPDLDCKATECVLKVFGDHTEGFTPVAEVPVSFS